MMRKMPASSLRQYRGNGLCSHAIRVGLNDSSAGNGLRLFLKVPVVLRDSGQINREDRAGASDRRC